MKVRIDILENEKLYYDISIILNLLKLGNFELLISKYGFKKKV